MEAQRRQLKIVWVCDDSSQRISSADEWGSQRSLPPQYQLGESMLMLWLLGLRFQKPAKALGAGRAL